MAFVLTEGSNVTCGHGGTVSTTSRAKLKVRGDSVLLRNGIELRSVQPGTCSNQQNYAQGLRKCSTVSTVVSGEARKLRVDGSAVMLETLHGATDGNPIGTLHANANQDKLTAI